MRIGEALPAVPPPTAPAPAPSPSPAARLPDEGPSAFAKILHGLGRQMDRGEAMVERATSAGGTSVDLPPADLLALQAGVYRYSEAVDLSAKLVDRATNGVKTVLQGQ
jgi:hypothetical protein